MSFEFQSKRNKPWRIKHTRSGAVYTNKTLQVFEIDIPIYGFHDHAWIEIPTAKGETVFCGCMHKCLDGADKNGCLEITQAIINLQPEAYRRNPNMLITGDFNYK